eukprot:jgi/Psemu1/26767/gm1.26767_g
MSGATKIACASAKTAVGDEPRLRSLVTPESSTNISVGSVRIRLDLNDSNKTRSKHRRKSDRAIIATPSASRGQRRVSESDIVVRPAELSASTIGIRYDPGHEQQHENVELEDGEHGKPQ